MKILISNVYSWKNKGDAGIVICMLEHLRHIFPNSKMSISSYDLEDRGKYDEDEFCLNILSLLKNKKNNFLTLQRIFNTYNKIIFKIKIFFFNYLRKIGSTPYWLFSDNITAKIKSYETSDLVIACGGGYIMTSQASTYIEKLFGCHDLDIFCYDFYLAKTFGIPYILYNQSIGPFYDDTQAASIKKYLQGANVIICREEITYKRLITLDLKNVLLGADIAFNLTSKQCDVLNNYAFDNSNNNIGITLRKWLDTISQSHFENQILDFIISSIVDNDRTHFFLMPQVVFENVDDNDVVVYQAIYNKLPDKYKMNVHIINIDLHPSELKYLISKMSYFIGTRMHSNIFALSSNIKTIAIAYESKTTGIMDMLGLVDYTIAMKELTSAILKNKFRQLKKDDKYFEILSMGLKRINKLNDIALNKYIHHIYS